MLLESDLREIVSVRQPARQSIPYRDEYGREWLTVRQAVAKYSSIAGFGRTLLLYWSKRPSRLRPGEPALHKIHRPNLTSHHGSPAHVACYLDDDIRAILAEKELRQAPVREP
jgi:hypothetical protein